MNIGAVTSSNQISACYDIVDLHKLCIIEDFTNVPQVIQDLQRFLILSKFSMNFCKSYQYAAIWKISNISKNGHGRFTVNYSKFL